MSNVLSTEQAGSITTVWLDRPEARNAMGADLWHDLPALMDSLGSDPAVRAIIIAARGDHFTVGLDLKEFGASLMAGFGDAGGVAGRVKTRAQVKLMQHTMTSIARCPKPVIAAIHGYCIGAGVDLITACDIRYAAADAVFSVRETKLAMVADVGTLQRLPSIVDPGWVAEVAFTGRDFTAAEALEMGLVTKVLADAEAVQKEALALAEQIAANSPLAVQGTKAVLQAGRGRSIEESLDYVALWNAAYLHSDDLVEAMAAFAERRSPDFRGR